MEFLEFVLLMRVLCEKKNHIDNKYKVQFKHCSHLRDACATDSSQVVSLGKTRETRAGRRIGTGDKRLREALN